MSSTPVSRERVLAGTRSALLRIGAVIGVGVAGTIDEVVFHQLLQWHNLYVHTDSFWRIFSDGVLHVFSSALLLVGIVLLWHRRRLMEMAHAGRTIIAGILIGMGGFNLYDGTIQHKVLQLHPVREGVENILPYDVAWNVVSLGVLVIGIMVWRSVRAEPE